MECDVSTGGKKNNVDGANDSPIIEPSKKTNQNENSYRHYLKRPKNQISALTLIAILWYTVLTQFEVHSAQQQVVIMKDQETRQLRAYLAMPQQNAVISFQPPSTLATIELEVAIKNIGLTPAFNVVGESWVDLLPWPIPRGFVFPEPPDPNGNSESVVAPGETVEYRTGSGRPLTTHEMQMFQQGQIVLYVYGLVKYDDALGNQRYTNFCLAYSGAQQGPYSTTIMYCPTPYNDAD